MADNLAEDLKEFDQFFGKFKGSPVFEYFRNGYIDFRVNHPEWQKPSDLPVAKEFPSIDFDNVDLMTVLLKHGLKIKTDLFNQFAQSRKKGAENEWEFIKNIIEQLVKYRVIARVLQVKLQDMESKSSVQ